MYLRYLFYQLIILQTKQDMKIAPYCRAYLNSDKKKCMDKCISQCEKKKEKLYLSLLKTGNHKPSKSQATWPVSVEDDDDPIIIGTYIVLFILLHIYYLIILIIEIYLYSIDFLKLLVGLYKLFSIGRRYYLNSIIILWRQSY